MRMCSFPGCQRLHGHSANVPHSAWDKDSRQWAPLAEQRTRTQIAREAEAAKLREKAERIARTVRVSNGHGLNDRQVRMDGHELQRLLTAAALAALTEKENAR